MNLVKDILEDVKRKGDLAILKYNKKFDNNNSKRFQITKRQIKKAYQQIDKETLSALKFAAKNIKFFAKQQKKQLQDFEVKTNFGSLGQKIIPIEKVGCYAPGGNYPLPSTALMTAIPAKVAGVSEIVVCSPKISAEVIVAANLAGATKIFNVGGVQAIAALAYGTKQIPSVNKIVGPGNKYVTEAKRQVFGKVGIDFIAGPSEVLIVADKNANAKFIAADLLAQAEHDTNAKANLITTSKKIAEQVKIELQKQLKCLETKEIASGAIKNSKIIFVETLSGAIKIANSMAPEHLELQIKNPEKIIPKLKNYGSLFVGEKSAEALGDYCLGPNHTLPTNRTAKYCGGLSVRDFVKVVTIQKVGNPDNELINCASRLAEIEGLYGHKKAAELRKKS